MVVAVVGQQEVIDGALNALAIFFREMVASFVLLGDVLILKLQRMRWICG